MNRYILLLTTLLLFSCEREKEVKTFGETEYYFDEKLTSISMGEDGKFWVGSETGGLFEFKDNHRIAYDLIEDRIYKVMNDVTAQGDSVLWMGIRNSGLQQWTKDEASGLRKLKTYTIDIKGDKYSPYDFLKVGNKIYVGTSQGLFYLDLERDNGNLNLIYASEEYHTHQENNTYIVHNLCNYKDSLLLGASQEGLIRYDMEKDIQEFILEGTHVEHVSIYNDTVYTVTNENLYLMDFEGEILKTIPAGNSPKLYYQIQGIHYLVGAAEIMLSKDLEDFVKIQLRRYIPTQCRNLIVPDTVNNFTYLVTEKAVWRIPNNIDVFKSNKSVMVSCFRNGKMYFLSQENELYVQSQGSNKAEWIYTFPKDNVINWMDVVDNELYVCNVDNVFQKITISDSWFRNILRRSPQEIYRSKARINSVTMKKMGDGVLAFLGTQEGLISIARSGRTDTIPEIYGMYITSMFGHDYSGRIYISTLNNGVYYISQDNLLRKLPETENRYFIRDIIATNDHNANLIMLTSQQIISQNPYDSIRVKGYQKLLYVNDTVFYGLPESGIHKFAISNGRIENRGTSYNDIRFNKNSTFADRNNLALGSSVGVLNISVDGGRADYWTDFEQALNINVFFAVSIAIVIILIVAIVLIIVLRKGNVIRIYIRKHKDDLDKRINDLLSYSNILEKNEMDEVTNLRNLIAGLDLRSGNPQAIKNELDTYSLRLAQINREIGLLLPKKLDLQIAGIAAIDVYEREALLKESKEVSTTSNIQRINDRVKQNSLWLQQRDKLISDLQETSARIAGWVEIAGINDGISERLVTINENLKQKPIDALTVMFDEVHSRIAALDTPEFTEKIRQYTDGLTVYLKTKTTQDPALAFLTERLDELVFRTSFGDTISYLKALEPIAGQVSILKNLDEIKANAVAYRQQHDRIIKENEAQINKKFDKELSNYIADATKNIIHTINSQIDSLYDKLLLTDKHVVQDILKLTNIQGQHARVLAILIADLKVKRSLIPGMLGIYGNLNPVISRLINDRIRANENYLKDYFSKQNHKTVFVHQVLRLLE